MSRPSTRARASRAHPVRPAGQGPRRPGEAPGCRLRVPAGSGVNGICNLSRAVIPMPVGGRPAGSCGRGFPAAGSATAPAPLSAARMTTVMACCGQPRHDAGGRPRGQGVRQLRRKAPLLAIFLALVRTGSTTFGGMWAATQQLEKDLVLRRSWLSAEQLRTSIVMATLIPAPRFLAFGGLVGFRMGGWLGSLAAITGLVLPASLLVLAGVRLISPELLGGPLAPLTRVIGIAVVGL